MSCSRCYSPYDPCAPCTCNSRCLTPSSYSSSYASTPFSGGIKIQNSWTIPAVGVSAELDAPYVKNVGAGMFLWNSAYGFLRISSVNETTGKISVTNDGLPGTAAIGTSVPANTIFLLAPGSRTLEEGEWDLTFISANDMPFNVTAIDSSVYTLDGNKATINARFKGNFSGVNRPEFSINLPFPGVQTGDNTRTQFGIFSYDEDNTISKLGVFWVNSNGPTCNLRKQAFDDYIVGVDYVFNVACTYVRDH